MLGQRRSCHVDSNRCHAQSCERGLTPCVTLRNVAQDRSVVGKRCSQSSLRRRASSSKTSCSTRPTALNSSRTLRSTCSSEQARHTDGTRPTDDHRVRKRQQPSGLSLRVIVRFGLVTVSRSTRPLLFRRPLHEAQALRLSPSCEKDQPCGNRSRPE